MSFIIEGDKRSPRVEIDSNRGLIEISGISLPENPYNYYLPLQEELDNYLSTPKEETTLIFKLEYFNTGSALALRNVIQKLNDKLPTGTFNVKWYYETDDSDMFDSGEEFNSLFDNATFEIIEIEEF